MKEIISTLVKKTSVGDLVFFIVGVTVCYLAIFGLMSAEQFIGIVGMVFGAYYVHSKNKKPKNEDGTDSDNQP